MGFAWNPQVTRAQVGDEIEFVWELPQGIQFVVIGPFTTSDPVTQEYDGNGFNVPPTRKGSMICYSIKLLIGLS